MNLDTLRTICMSFPGATEGIKWEDHICFMVGEKMYCITGEWGGVSIKVTPEQFDELTERDGITPTAYMARNKWVTIAQFDKLKRAEWDFYLRQSYDIIRSKLPKKLQNELG